MRGNSFLVCSVCDKNRFRVCSACDKIVSAYAQHTHAAIFEKYHIKMQILTRNNQNFLKPSRNPSNRTTVKILKKKKFWIAHQKIWIRVCSLLSHRGNVRTSKFWRKSKEKKRNFFRKFTNGI